MLPLGTLHPTGVTECEWLTNDNDVHHIHFRCASRRLPRQIASPDEKIETPWEAFITLAAFANHALLAARTRQTAASCASTGWGKSLPLWCSLILMVLSLTVET